MFCCYFINLNCLIHLLIKKFLIALLDRPLMVTSTIICQREFEKLLMIDMIDYLVQLIYIFFAFIFLIALTYITCYATRSKR